MKKLINWILTGAIALFLFILFLTNYLHYKPIQPFGITLLKVSSNSMKPELQTGDLILVKKEKTYEIGEIITYQTKDGYLITHRIIEQGKNGFITQGDANNCADELTVKQEQIIGKVIQKVAIVRQEGKEENEH